jgi:hypothetical protein
MAAPPPVPVVGGPAGATHPLLPFLEPHLAVAAAMVQHGGAPIGAGAKIVGVVQMSIAHVPPPVIPGGRA